MMLTVNELDQFKEEGYLLYEGLLYGDTLAKYVNVFDELVERAKNEEQGGHWSFELDAEGTMRPEKMLHKIQGVCCVDPRALDMAKEPCITGRVAQLIGDHLDIFGTKFFPLLPGGGTSTQWHQDNYYFDTQSEEIVTCGIYLHDSDKQNGCLRIVPRSHHAGMLEHTSNAGTYGSWIEMDDSDAIDLEVPGGTVVLFSANLLHGANKNVSDRPRYSTAWHYVPASLDLQQFPRGVYEDRHVVLGE
jgi:ectoine hydroxylase-related dioxygenase (phytanoyl-CoA dioxygenase family)